MVASLNATVGGIITITACQEDLERGSAKLTVKHAKLNKEDAMDRSRWRKWVKDV